MLIKRRVLAASAAVLWCAVRAKADEGLCGERIDRGNLVRCALSASLRAQAERFGGEAAAGREQAARTLLPQNPVLALSGARRTHGQLEQTNWYATLSQEVEVAGQRGARRRAASAERRAQELVVTATEREAAASAWRSYFEALAARDAVRLSERLVDTFAHAHAATQAAAQSGLASGLDADLADAMLVGLQRSQIEAARRERTATAVLATAVGVSPASDAIVVDGDLTPLVRIDGLATELATNESLKRPEVEAATATQAAAEQRVEVYRRSRMPSLTISALAQRDGFDERVLGGGISMPIPLPHPLGRTFAGEIAESRALARRAESELQLVQREVQLEALTAAQAYEAARADSALFTEERVRRAEQSLSSIADGIRGGRLAIRDAVVAQQALIDLLRARVDAQLALCLSSVELARAAGLPLVERTP